MGVIMQVEASCRLCCHWGHLARYTVHTKASHYLFGVCGPLSDFLRNLQCEPRQIAYVKKLLEAGRSGCASWVARVSGNHQGRVKVLATLMETQIWHLRESAGWVKGELNTCTVVSGSTSVS